MKIYFFIPTFLLIFASVKGTKQVQQLKQIGL